MDYEKVLCFPGTECQDALDFGVSNEVKKKDFIVTGIRLCTPRLFFK